MILEAATLQKKHPFTGNRCGRDVWSALLCPEIRSFAVGRNPGNQMYGKPFESYGKTVIYVICSISTL